MSTECSRNFCVCAGERRINTVRAMTAAPSPVKATSPTPIITMEDVRLDESAASRVWPVLTCQACQ